VRRDVRRIGNVMRGGHLAADGRMFSQRQHDGSVHGAPPQLKPD
jgi:hypothetical protein